MAFGANVFSALAAKRNIFWAEILAHEAHNMTSLKAENLGRARKGSFQNKEIDSGRKLGLSRRGKHVHDTEQLSIQHRNVWLARHIPRAFSASTKISEREGEELGASLRCAMKSITRTTKALLSAE